MDLPITLVHPDGVREYEATTEAEYSALVLTRGYKPKAPAQEASTPPEQAASGPDPVTAIRPKAQKPATI